MKIYKFTLEDHEGKQIGWNDVQSTSMVEARRKAKKEFTTKPKWIHYEVLINGKTEDRKEWYLGMRPRLSSFKRQSFEDNWEDHRMAEMMSR